MKLDEAVALLRANKFIVEDTDDWDEADMPAGMSPNQRQAMVAKHNGRLRPSSVAVGDMLDDNPDRSLDKKICMGSKLNKKSIKKCQKKFVDTIYSLYDPDFGGRNGYSCETDGDWIFISKSGKKDRIKVDLWAGFDGGKLTYEFSAGVIDGNSSEFIEKESDGIETDDFEEGIETIVALVAKFSRHLR